MGVRIVALFVLLTACAPAAPDDGPSITGACVRSFRPTLEAWEMYAVRVPAECAYLDGELDVVLASKAEIPCTTEASTELVIGCYQPGDAIYLLEGRDAVQLVDTSVHEWVHALADCVLGYPDILHLRADLWAQYGTETVELQAQASAEIGACL